LLALDLVKNPIRDLVLGAAVPCFIAAGADQQMLAWLRWLLAVAAQRRRRIRRFVGTCRDFPHD
jgi:hypothetical protein